MPISLLQAKIRGFRSYSPLPDKTQVIDFMPLTLIVGSNGSGKTSVIECLKFIISGDEPPLSDSRRNFIHENKKPVEGMPENCSYASVELQFNNAKDLVCFAKRDINLAGKTKGATPSINSSYKIGDKPWSHVNRQDDWNKTLPSLFNLQNLALLNNVILCHQENNLWCMADSSHVKQIFDRIFGCEQYKKEIKYIEAEIKSAKIEISMCEREAMVCKDKLNRMHQLEAEMGNLSSELKKFAIDTDEIDTELLETRKVKNSSCQIMDKLIQKEREIMSLKNKASELRSRDVKIRGYLKQNFIDPESVSDEELRKRKDEHFKLVNVKRDRHSELRTKNEEVTLKVSLLESRRKEVQDILNKLKVIELKSRESHASLIAHLKRLKEDPNMNPGLDSLEVEDCLDILKKFESKLMQNKTEITESEDNLAVKHSNLTKSLNKLEGNYEGLLKQKSGKEQFLTNLNEQLALIDPTTKDLTKVSENLKKMTSLTSRMAKSSFVNDLNKLIDDSATTVDILLKRIRDDNVTKLESNIERQNKELQACIESLKDIDLKRNEVTNKCNEVEKDHKVAIIGAKDAHNKLITFKSVRSNIVSIRDRYLQEKKFLEAKNMNDKLAEMDKIDKSLEETQALLKDIQSELSKLGEERIQETIKGMDLDNNLEIREILFNLKELDAQIGNIEQEFGGKDAILKLQKIIDDSNVRELELREKKSVIVGSKARIDREIATLYQELQSHNKTHSNHSKIIGRLVTGRIILGDLEKLRDCFNESITAFHNQMLKRINEVLRSRWRQIYKGSDIDQIQLVDEEITRGKDKKAYNYYISMRHNGVHMKMREKSSAGQKALASIILRMTLAELFVKDFAFIALDEPTANLDIANVQSLAKAIGSYVKRRTQKGANIQWIIITHDELFLKALDAECSPYFYKVLLDSKGYSQIVKVAYQEFESVSSSLQQ